MVLEEALEGEDNVGGEGEGGLALELTLRQLSLQLRVPDKDRRLQAMHFIHHTFRKNNRKIKILNSKKDRNMSYKITKGA